MTGRSLLHLHREAKTLSAFHIQWRNRMTRLKLLSAALIAATALATPAMARESGVASPRPAEQASASNTPGARYFDERLCNRAPAVGAFATQPWDNAPPCEPAPAY
jgi:hypothetical protein